MHVLHEHEEPDFRVLGGFFEACERGCLALLADGVALDAGVSELPFVLGEPAGAEGVVGEGEDRAESDDESYSALEDEEPNI